MKILRSPVWVVLWCNIAVTACSTTVPPRELIERNDHSGLAAWYEQEASRLRGKAEEMSRMIERYAAPSYPLSPKESKAELVAHCRSFLGYYTKAAEEAEALATLHRQQKPAMP